MVRTSISLYPHTSLLVWRNVDASQIAATFGGGAPLGMRTSVPPTPLQWYRGRWSVLGWDGSCRRHSPRGPCCSWSVSSASPPARRSIRSTRQTSSQGESYPKVKMSPLPDILLASVLLSNNPICWQRRRISAVPMVPGVPGPRKTNLSRDDRKLFGTEYPDRLF